MNAVCEMAQSKQDLVSSVESSQVSNVASSRLVEVKSFTKQLLSRK